MPNSEGAENITLRTTLTKRLRDEWDKDKNENPYAETTFNGYVNELLMSALAKKDFMKSLMPHYRVSGINSDTIYIKDDRQERSIEVRLRRGQMQCLKDNSNDCIHVRFALGTSAVAKLKNSILGVFNK